MNNTVRAINILLFLSDFKAIKSEKNPWGATVNDYTLEESDRCFKGTQTNEAPIKYLFEQAQNKQGYVKRIICITSFKVMKEPNDYPQIQRFKEFVKLLALKTQKEEPEYVLIPYDYDEKIIEKVKYGKKLPAMIYNKLENCFQKITPGEEIFIDYTGGLRDISFLMTSLIRFLEFKGLKCGEIVYSNNFSHQICDIHYIYDVYQMINGVTEFSNTGNARELKKVYKNVRSNGPAENVVNKLIDFSDALSICDIGKLDEKVNNLIEAINQLEESNDDDINTAMFKTIAPTIREKMYLYEEPNYPRMVQWCAENNLIQQAATIYTEKLPKFYFENNLVPGFVNLESLTLGPGQSIYTVGYYTELFDRVAEGLEIVIFRQFLQNSAISFNGSMNRNQILSKLEEEKENNTNSLESGDSALRSLINNAYDCLINFIHNCYDENCINKKNDASYSIYHRWELSSDSSNDLANEDGYTLRTVTIPNKFRKFWEELIYQNIYWLHRFLYNDETSYLTITTPKNRKSDKTYRKKAFAIQRIKNGEIVIGDIDLQRMTWIRMAFYLTVKIMRNRMNHAGEGDRTHDELQAINYINGLGIGIHFEDDLTSYKKILLDGINHSNT